MTTVCSSTTDVLSRLPLLSPFIAASSCALLPSKNGDGTTRVRSRPLSGAPSGNCGISGRPTRTKFFSPDGLSVESRGKSEGSNAPVVSLGAAVFCTPICFGDLMSPNSLPHTEHVIDCSGFRDLQVG